MALYELHLDEDEVQSFEHHTRTYQQTDDSSRHKEHVNAANANANTAKEKPYYNWSSRRKGSSGHTAKTIATTRREQRAHVVTR